MALVRGTFHDRRVTLAPSTHAEVREHLSSAHGQEASARSRVGDLHDLHNDLHEMPASHGH